MDAVCLQGIAAHVTVQADVGPGRHQGELHPHHLAQTILPNNLQGSG
jgi:hypothetical protein